MRNYSKKNQYIFYTGEPSLQPDTAHEIHDVLCANAAANLGYSSVLIYPDKKHSVNLLSLIYPYQPKRPGREFIEFYDVQEKLKIAPLPMPWPIDKIGGKFTNSSTVVTKYYLPIHIRPNTKVVHTRDWNFVKAAVKNKIPTIYERHYFQDQKFEPEIVHSPYFKIAITQSELIRQSLIEYAMPPEKVVWLHNGFNQSFSVRQPQEAETWRQELLINGRKKHLVIYSGALYPFKGVNLLIDCAKELPEIQFVITGGTEAQVQAYQQLAREKNVENVKLLGWILLRERLVSLFQAADILVHPHCAGKSADFTNPVKFFQYMAAGTPIVATEIPPLMEFKTSPLIASWCTPDNPHKLAQSIQHTLETYPRKIEGYAASIDFAQQFSWENRINKILSYLEEDQRPSILG